MKLNRIGLLFFLIASLGRALAAQRYDAYSYVFNQRQIMVPVGEIDGVRFNDICLKDEDHCEALKFYRNPKVPPSKGNRETFSAEYCRSVGGTLLLLTAPTLGTSLFCVFHDMSMVDARALSAQAGRSGGKR